MQYISTRGQTPPADFTTVLLQGLAPDGGLYVPTVYPRIAHADMLLFANAPYAQVATRVLHPYMADTINEADLFNIVQQSYASFSHPATTPLTQINTNHWLLELFHGPTLAFKDVALQFLGNIANAILQKRGQSITVLGATSGDTGPAALAGFAHCNYADSFILYPHNRPSNIQRRQMTCLNNPRVHALAIDGTFDDCQAIVKTLFADAAFRAQANLTAVNSVNWVRIAAQSVYYVLATAILGPGTAFAVPTGNFGNIFAAYTAKRCGVPIGPLLVGTNKNDILARAIQQGQYQVQQVHDTLAPAMDIQVASNFERLLFELLDRNTGALNAHMTQLQQHNGFTLTPDVQQQLQQICFGYSVDDAAIIQTMQQIYATTGQIIDPHTAVGVAVAQYWQQKHTTPIRSVVSLACAHPAKFLPVVQQALGYTPPLPAAVAHLPEKAERITVLPASAAAVRDYLTQHTQALR